MLELAFIVLPATRAKVTVPHLIMLLAVGINLIPNLTNLALTQVPTPFASEPLPASEDYVLVPMLGPIFKFHYIT